MAKRKNYKVLSEVGLNLREKPSKTSRVLKVLAYEDAVVLDNEVETPDGWAAVKDGGYVMKEFIG